MGPASRLSNSEVPVRTRDWRWISVSDRWPYSALRWKLSLQVRAGRAAGRQLFERLEARGVICDWREPDIIRAAPVPLNNTLDEVEALIELMGKLLTA